MKELEEDGKEKKVKVKTEPGKQSRIAINGYARFSVDMCRQYTYVPWFWPRGFVCQLK